MPLRGRGAALLLVGALVAGLFLALLLGGCSPETSPTASSAGAGPKSTEASPFQSTSSTTVAPSGPAATAVSTQSREILAKAIAQAEKQDMKATVMSLLGARTDFFYNASGWMAEMVPERPLPGEAPSGPAAGRFQDRFFWLTSFEGEERIVATSGDEMVRLWRDRTVCRQETERGIRLLVQMLVSSPLEQLKYLESTEEPQELPGGGWRVKGTLRLFDIVNDTVSRFGDGARLVEDPYDLYQAITTVTLDVDASGAPTRSVSQLEAEVEGQRVQPFESQWTSSAAQPPSLSEDALSLGEVVAEPWPTGWMPSYSLPAPKPTAASLTAYLRQQEEYLASALRELGHAEMRGLVTFAEPLDDRAALAVVGTPNLRREYLEWVTSDGEQGRTSGCVAKTAEEVRKIFYPQEPGGHVQLVGVGLIGAHRDYPLIADNPAVLLVDLGPVPKLIPLIKKGESVIGQPTRGFYWLWKEAGSPTMFWPQTQGE